MKKINMNNLIKNFQQLLKEISENKEVGQLWKEWKEKEIAEILNSKWLTKEEKDSIIKDIEEKPKSLRENFKFWALNMFGKKSDELTPKEIREILDEMFKNEYRLRGNMPVDVLKDLFRYVFKNELRKIK